MFNATITQNVYLTLIFLSGTAMTIGPALLADYIGSSNSCAFCRESKLGWVTYMCFVVAGDVRITSTLVVSLRRFGLVTFVF